jgi:hypothetical protein
MRHGATLLASLEGLSRPAFRIATELSNNSRSGLTVRFLSKKLDMPEEEVEYLLDIHPRLIFTDLTKVKIVSEGLNLVRRISEGLENRGDIDSLFRRVKTISPHDFRVLEEKLGIEEAITKKQAVELLLEKHYKHPDSVVTYVATRPFSPLARELFDIVWQSKEGIMTTAQLRAAHGAPEAAVEEALLELFQGFALFEMFRFDSEDRLVRAAGLLKEVRQHRDAATKAAQRKPRLKPLRIRPETILRQELAFSETISRLLAAIAARPARLRGDGELFREDRKRLSEICPEEADPSLNTCLWVAEGAGWLARVDNTLRAGNMDALIPMDRVERHKALCDWLLARGDEATSRKLMIEALDELKPDAWHAVTEFVAYAMSTQREGVQPTLKSVGNAWDYAAPGAGNPTESRLARSIEESFYWLGLIDRAEADGDSVFRLTDLGHAYFSTGDLKALAKRYPRPKGEIIVQPNFDIVVPVQDMDPLLTVPLDQFAIRASTGQATVYNVTKESFTQAMQEGHDADAFVRFLLAHARGGALPPNVLQTLEDWRGGLKRIRIRAIHVIESEDPLVMADLMHRRRFTKFLEPVDARLLVKFHKISRQELAKALEKDGFIVE